MAETIWPSSPAEWRAWLAANHETATEVLLGYWKKASGVPSLTWSESVDEALCFGWIDGIRRTVDEQRYTLRFTPRKPTSHWSRVNVDKVERLRAEGLMTPAGEAAFARRSEANTAIHGYEQREAAVFPPELQAMLDADPAAAAYWATCPPGYRKTVTVRVISAKKDETRRKRMAQLVEACAAGRRL